MKKILLVAAISLAVLNPINTFACANGLTGPQVTRQ